jgi:hypothetical protein
VIRINSSLNKKTGFLNMTYESQRRISIDTENLSKNIKRKNESQVKRICNENHKKTKKKRIKGKNGNPAI